MLREIEKTKQIPDEGRRRWFTDDYFDLIVWYDDGGEIDGFQLCYDKEMKERAFTWRKTGTVTHQAVDDGERYGYNKMTPIMVQDGLFDATTVSRCFAEHAANLDPVLFSFIQERISSM